MAKALRNLCVWWNLLKVQVRERQFILKQALIFDFTITLFIKVVFWRRWKGGLQKRKDGGVEERTFIFSCENSRIATLCRTTIDRRMLDPTKKKKKKNTPHPRAKEKHNRTAEGVKSHLESKPQTHQRHSEGSNKISCTPGPRDPTETEPDLPLGVWVSSTVAQSAVAYTGTGLWLQQIWEAWHVT